MTVVLDSLKVSNVLELTDRQREIIMKLREFMREQADSLRNEVEGLQENLIHETFNKNNGDEDEDDMLRASPSAKELKEYAGKLQEELLQSDQNIRRQKALQTNLPPVKFGGKGGAFVGTPTLNISKKTGSASRSGSKNRAEASREMDPLQKLLIGIPDAAAYL